MDPISTTNLIQDRIAALQQTADELRLERRLRATPTTSTMQVAQVVAASTAPASRPAETRRAPAKAGDCVPIEPAA
jgi:hypothetical protein